MASFPGSERDHASGDHPSLRHDIDIAGRVLEPAFRDADDRAARNQRKFRTAELSVIYGGAVAVALGVVAGFAENSTLTTTLATTESLLAAALGSLAFISRGLGWHRRWLRGRWLAEMLRSERFMFIGRQGVYAGTPEPERLLRKRLVEIERTSREAKTRG